MADEGDGGMITRTEIDGIPVLATPDGPVAAGITFRVGYADETLARHGITHLTEHLALYRLGAREAWDIEVGTGSYYYVLDGEKVEVESGPDDRERVERTVLKVGEGVLGQDFEPRPSPAVCSWCDYRLVCPASEA